MRHTHTTTPLAPWLALLLTLTACTNDRDARLQAQALRNSYAQALARRPKPRPVTREDEAASLLQSDERRAAQLPTHLALSLRPGALNDLVKRATLKALRGALASGDGDLDVAGKKLPYRMRADAVAVGLEASDKCATCVKIGGKLLGKLGFSLPLIGQVDVPVSGDYGLVAPLVFSREGDALVIALDLKQAPRFGGFLVDARLDKLPSSLRGKVQQRVQRRLTSLPLFERQITLLKLPASKLGVKDLVLLPAALTIDAQTGALTLGLWTNLAPLSRTPMSLPARLSADDGVGVHLHADWLRGVSAARRADPERFLHDGLSNPDGPLRLIWEGWRTPAPGTLALDFSVWRLPDDDHPQGFTTRGTATIALSGRQATLKGVSLENPERFPHPDHAASWRKGVFLQAHLDALNTALRAPGLPLPATGASLGLREVIAADGAVRIFGGLR